MNNNTVTVQSLEQYARSNPNNFTTSQAAKALKVSVRSVAAMLANRNRWSNTSFIVPGGGNTWCYRMPENQEPSLSPKASKVKDAIASASVPETEQEFTSASAEAQERIFSSLVLTMGLAKSRELIDNVIKRVVLG